MTSVMNRRRVQRHHPVATGTKTAKVGAVKTGRKRRSRAWKVVVSCMSGLLGARHPGEEGRPRIGSVPKEVAIPHAYGTCSRTTKPELRHCQITSTTRETARIPRFLEDPASCSVTRGC